MTKILQLPLLWLLTGLLGLTSARASHIQGGQISYRYVGPGAAGTDRYNVTVTYFRDCTGTTLPGSLSLLARRGAGCTGARRSPAL